MSVIDRTLFGDIDKVKIAIDRLQNFEPPDGYYVAFSGGKDSQVIYHLCVEAGVKFDAHFMLTTVDPPELVYHIKKNYSDVTIHRPEKTMWQLIIENGMPPSRIMRYCCKSLKEKGGGGRRVVTGIRWEESVRRSKRNMVETCYQDETKVYLNPIIDWLESDVWQYIKSRNIGYCKLYDEGYHRIGCILCPMANRKGMERDAERFPKYKDQYIRTFDKMLKVRKEKGLETKWKTGQEVFDWWIKNDRGQKKDPDQTIMFE